MRTLLVTGGAGFIGGAFVMGTVANGDCTVINLDAMTYAGNPEILNRLAGDPNHIFVRGDIRDRPLIDSILKKYEPDGIIHFAAESHVDRSIDGPADFVMTNMVGTFTLLEAAREYVARSKKGLRFLQVSTDEVYGSLGDEGSFVETTPYQPNSPYSASKAGADHLVRAYHHTYGLDTIITNCSNNYGPFQFPEKLIPLVIRKALSGEPIPVYGDGANIRDWLYVEDHCRAVRMAFANGTSGEVYNIGGRSEKTNLEVVKTLCATLDEMVPDSSHTPREKLITFVKDRPGHDQRYAIDPAKIERELSFTPAETFETGIKKTVRWYLDNGDWLEKIASGGYDGERLGLASKGGK